MLFISKLSKHFPKTWTYEVTCLCDVKSFGGTNRRLHSYWSTICFHRTFSYMWSVVPKVNKAYHVSIWSDYYDFLYS